MTVILTAVLVHPQRHLHPPTAVPSRNGCAPGPQGSLQATPDHPYGVDGVGGVVLVAALLRSTAASPSLATA